MLDAQIAVMKEMAWSWFDLMATPEYVVARVMELLQQRQSAQPVPPMGGGAAWSET